MFAGTDSDAGLWLACGGSPPVLSALDDTMLCEGAGTMYCPAKRLAPFEVLLLAR